MLPIDLLIAQVHTIVLGVAADQAVPVPGHPHHLAVLPIDLLIAQVPGYQETHYLRGTLENQPSCTARTLGGKQENFYLVRSTQYNDLWSVPS